MNRAADDRQAAYDDQDRAWLHYLQILDTVVPELNKLDGLKAHSAKQSKASFRKARSYSKYRDKANRLNAIDDGYRYDNETVSYDDERSRLKQKITAARNLHDRTILVSQQATDTFVACECTHAVAKTEYLRVTAELEYADAEYTSLTRIVTARREAIEKQQHRATDTDQSLVSALSKASHHRS